MATTAVRHLLACRFEPSQVNSPLMANSPKLRSKLEAIEKFVLGALEMVCHILLCNAFRRARKAFLTCIVCFRKSTCKGSRASYTETWFVSHWHELKNNEEIGHHKHCCRKKTAKRSSLPWQ